jgi:hypothetical protein
MREIEPVDAHKLLDLVLERPTATDCSTCSPSRASALKEDVTVFPDFLTLAIEMHEKPKLIIKESHHVHRSAPTELNPSRAAEPDANRILECLLRKADYEAQHRHQVWVLCYLASDHRSGEFDLLETLRNPAKMLPLIIVGDERSTQL